MSGLTKTLHGGFPSRLPAIQLVLAGVSLATWRASRRAPAVVSISRDAQPKPPGDLAIGAP
jgi:hypothetical protein